MTIASCHTQACFDAWMKCEDLMVSIAGAELALSRKITRILDECSLICMGTFNALKSRSANLSRMALLCVGICEECAELCEDVKREEFMQCAKACRECSETMTEFAFTNLQ
jgi:hypothetical protein